MIEVEARARVENLNEVRENLEEKSELVQEKRQIDRIFGHDMFLDDDRKIIEGGLSARIRKVNDRDPRLDFKEINRGSGGLEISIDLDSLKEGEKFLEKLGFEEAFTISKNRKVFSLDGFEICLDEVEKLGTFVEVEKEISDEDKKEIVFKNCKRIMEEITPQPKFIDKKYGDLMQERIDKEKD